MGRKKKTAIVQVQETNEREIIKKKLMSKAIPDESTFDNTQTLYEYSCGKSCRIDYDPYINGLDFNSFSLSDF